MATPEKAKRVRPPKPPQPVYYLYTGDPRVPRKPVELRGSRWYLDGRRPQIVVDSAIESDWLKHPLIAAAIAAGTLKRSTAEKTETAAAKALRDRPLTSDTARVVLR